MEAAVKALIEANVQQRETNQLLLQHVMALQAAGASHHDHDARKAVRAAIPKMTPSDDVETYLAVFEKVAVREKLPRDQWAEVVAPFLASGPQQVFFDLADAQAADYPTVKGEILARLGVNVLVRAQRVHQWDFKTAEPARPQYYELLHRLQKWLQPDVLSPTAMLDRLLADMFWRALPYPLQHWVGVSGKCPGDGRPGGALRGHQKPAGESCWEGVSQTPEASAPVPTSGDREACTEYTPCGSASRGMLEVSGARPHQGRLSASG